MRTLVVGYGSIGKRHISILNKIGVETGVVSRRNNIDYKILFNSIEDGIIIFKPDLIIVANETSEHLNSLIKILNTGFKGLVLMEKPLFSNYKSISNINISSSLKIFVGYNLRFHPLLIMLKEELKNQKVLSSNIYVGQYLPTWRPSIDYRDSYSAKYDKGGGVLRDLSHELDYINWIFGSWKRLCSIGGKYSSLEIDSEDCYSMLIETSDCPNVNLVMNYLDKINQRYLIVHTNQHTYKIDFIAGTFQKDEELCRYNITKNETYENQVLSILKGDFDSLCSFEEGLKVVKMIHAIEESNYSKRWVTND